MNRFLFFFADKKHPFDGLALTLLIIAFGC